MLWRWGGGGLVCGGTRRVRVCVRVCVREFALVCMCVCEYGIDYFVAFFFARFWRLEIWQKKWIANDFSNKKKTLPKCLGYAQLLLFCDCKNTQNKKDWNFTFFSSFKAYKKIHFYINYHLITIFSYRGQCGSWKTSLCIEIFRKF